MKVAVIKEHAPHESRVAVSEELVKGLTSLGLEVYVESNAGLSAHITDDDLKNAGAHISKDPTKLLKTADILLKVQPPSDSELSSIKRSAVVIGLLGSTANDKQIKKYSDKKITTFALEFAPRITRAQAMDVLSSQSNLAGYKAVIDAVATFEKAIPMMMTAAGTIKPAKVLVLGAGVAGLQAVATAKRLGAVVSVFDVRPAVKEQVESLGARFIEVESEESNSAETTGGYAREMSDDYKRRQSQLIQDTLADTDIVITTALIPGKPAPTLITDAMLKPMRAGSVIVDLATQNGGNCSASIKDKIVEKHGVVIIGYSNFPARLPYNASQLYAKNLLHFITLLINKKHVKIRIDFEDEIIQGTLITHEGKIVHPNFKELKPTPVTKTKEKTPSNNNVKSKARKPRAGSAQQKSLRLSK